MTRSVNHQMLTELQITQYTVYIAEHSLVNLEKLHFALRNGKIIKFELT